MGKKIIPRLVSRALQPVYHWGLSMFGAMYYGFPARSMKIIGVTGTKGKSTTVYMLARVLEEAGQSVAAIGSLGIKIKDKEWPNTLKMTMPGRMKLQKFLAEAKRVGCRYVVLEVTSEGLRQMRHIGIKFDCAIFTNLSQEHLESHGSFEKYMAAKQILFRNTRNIFVLNAEDAHVGNFDKFLVKRKLYFGLHHGDLTQDQLQLQLKLAGDFNVVNALAALTTAMAYGLDVTIARQTIENIATIDGRMEYIQREPFQLVVDYAHTPDSLEAVYRNLKPHNGKLICVLGSCGGGRDKWKRPIFGEIVSRYGDEIFLTDEDPYDEDPKQIVQDILFGIPEDIRHKVRIIMDRGEAIARAVKSAEERDVVIITGKGSETSIALANGKKLSWSDKEKAQAALR